MNKTFKIIVLVLTAIAVIFSTMFGVIAAKKASEISLGDGITIEGLEKEESNIGLVNILLIGVDKDGMRSDTIMLVSIDGYSNRVNLLSIPRDTKVKAQGYSTSKINALIGLGRQAAKSGKIKEPEELLIGMVKKITGLPVHYFMTVDFDGFKDIINALDGVDFNIPYKMDYDDPVQDLHIHLTPGMQHLDGQAAHDFVRFRHNNNGSAPGEYVMGDEGREYWQQEFLKELIRQKSTPKYISKLDDLFNVVKNNVRTNYTMKDLLSHLGLVKKINIDEIGSYQLPGQSEYLDSVWWYVYNEKQANELISAVFMPMNSEDWESYKNSSMNEAQKFKINAGGEQKSTAGTGVKIDDFNE